MEIKHVLQNIKIPEDHQFVFFDVKSLSTSIPTDPAVSTVTSDILSKNEAMLKERTNLNKNEIIDLINKRLQAAIFEYDGDVYMQTHGTPMGSPISVVLAELHSVAKDRRRNNE